MVRAAARAGAGDAQSQQAAFHPTHKEAPDEPLALACAWLLDVPALTVTATGVVLLARDLGARGRPVSPGPGCAQPGGRRARPVSWKRYSPAPARIARASG